MKQLSLQTRPIRKLGRLRLQELSSAAKNRLRWFDWHEQHGRNVSRTCRHFAISRSTFYFWQKRFNRYNLGSLEDRPSRPKRVRQRTWTTAEVVAIQALREAYPRWGKAKLAVLLLRQGLRVAVSRVGRILDYLKRSGKLKEPPRRLSLRHRRWKRPYATRKPREYPVTLPGDLVQMDTVDIQPVPGARLKQFTAIDVVSRWSVAFLASDATASSARRALSALQEQMPFPIRAIQVDGGSEFMSVFEEAVQDAGIRLFELPPRSPKLNGCVERDNRTYREEFYDCTTAPPTVSGLRKPLRRWDRIYNTIRPHQSLGYLTPAESLIANFPHLIRKEALSDRS
jgi:putative transposase